MRKLASIQRVLSVDPIPDADAIEVASILGWKCVVKKGEFSVGDPCVYIEVDSLLPDIEQFEFMKPRGMRVRTVRLRGQVSQGLALPVYPLMSGFDGLLPEGTDVSDMLGIVKYEAPVPAQLSGVAKGSFPGFLQKTDEDRIQSFPDILTKYSDTRCRMTEKLDGSSATYYLRDGEFGVCSRNLELERNSDNTFWRVAIENDIEQKLRSLGKNIAIQGELIGEGVQGNKYKIKGHRVYFFNVFDIDAGKPLDVIPADDLIDKMGLVSVPWLGDIERLGSHTVDTLIKKSDRPSVLGGLGVAEGIVIRSYGNVSETFVTGKTVDRGRLSFKVINPEFLIKHKE